QLTTLATFQSPGCFGVSWSADDKLLALATPDKGRVIWDVASQQPVPDAIVGGIAAGAVWHPTRFQLAFGTAGGDCAIWDFESRKIILRWKAHQGRVEDVKWSNDGTRILSSGQDGTARIWDAADGRELRSVDAHAGAANSVTWEPGGRRFATAGTD